LINCVTSAVKGNKKLLNKSRAKQDLTKSTQRPTNIIYLS